MTQDGMGSGNKTEFVLELTATGWLCDLGPVVESLSACVFSCVEGEPWIVEIPTLQSNACW